MVFQHVQLMSAVGSGEDSALGTAFLLLETAPAAPVQLLLAGFVLLWLLPLRWLDGRLAWRAVPRCLTSLSRNITAVYLIQWVLIGWLAITLGVLDQPPWLAVLLGVPILVASHLLALGYARLAAERRDRRRVPETVASEGE